MEEIPPTPMIMYLFTACTAIGGLMFGYDTGVISGAMLFIAEEFDLDVQQQELIVSATVGGCIVGALLAGVANSLFGRRLVVIFSSIVFVGGSALMAFAETYELLLVGRVVVGLGVGFASMTTPMYIAEVAPSHLRGRLVTVNNLFVTGGQFVAGLVDWGFSPVTEGWRYMLGLAAIPAAIQFFGFIVLPESPRWLVSKSRVTTAEAVLMRMRGTDDVQEELDAIVQSSNENKSSGSYTELITVPYIRRALILGCGLQILQQLSGINTVMYYSGTILKLAGFAKADAVALNALVAFTNFLFTTVGVVLVERLGRKILTLSSLLGSSLSMCVLGVAFYLQHQEAPAVLANATQGVCGAFTGCYQCVNQVDEACGYCPPTNTTLQPLGLCLEGTVRGAAGDLCAAEEWMYGYCPSSVGWLAVLGLVLYLACFASGMGPMPWTVNSEIYPLHIRSQAVSVATAFNWGGTLAVSLTFLSLTKAITNYGTFFLVAGIAAVGAAWLAWVMPETRGLKLEQIERLFMRDRDAYRTLEDAVDEVER